MNTSKENISAIIPMDKFENINEVIKSLIDIVAEIILINSSNNNFNFNNYMLKFKKIRNSKNLSLKSRTKLFF